MSKFWAVTLILVLAVGIVGVSFSVCQGLMPNCLELRSVADCSAGGFCGKMCRLAREESSALLQKKSSETLQEILTPILQTGQAIPLDCEPPAVKGAFLEIAIRHQHRPPDLYLLNAAFLI